MTSSFLAVCSWEAGGGGAPGQVEEVLTLAHRLAETLAADARWLVLGPSSAAIDEVASGYGVAGVDRIADPKLETFAPDPYVEALAQYCSQRFPRVLLFSQTFDARLVAPRLAARLDSAVVINGLDLDLDGDGRLQVTASAYGGDTRAVYALAGREPHIATIMPGAVSPEPSAPAASAVPVHDFEVDLGGVEERIRVVEPARAEGPRLEDAQTIVAGGRGLGSQSNFSLIEQLAEAVGGMAAASRPIVDDGWTDPSRQIGLTGKIARPALYVAAGISGASQHMAGCSAAGTIVAINSDPDAAIFRYARYGVVGDCVEILPELIRAVEGR